MTLSTTTARYQYAGNGVVSSFSFPAVFIDAADIVVSLRDAAGNVLSPTRGGGATYDYTVGATFDATTGEYLSGGFIAFNSPPPVGYRVTLYRDPPETQNVKLQTGSSFNVNTVNTEFDKLTMLVQALRDQLARGLVIPPDDLTSLSMLLPNSALRGGQLLGFDGNGAPALFTPTSQNLAVLGQVWKSGAAFLATSNYTASDVKTQIEAVLGSIATPDVTQDSVAIFQKTSSSGLSVGMNAALYASHSKRSGATGSHVVAAFFEGQADVSSALSTDFVEGVRGHGIINAGITGGSGYGGVLSGGEGIAGTHGGYLVGGEVEVINRSADAGAIWNSGNSTANHFEAGLVISASGTKKSLAGIIINPFTPTAAAFQFGMFIPPGQTNTPVLAAGIRIDCAASIGIDLSNSPGPTFAAIALNNNSPIRGLKFDRSTTFSMLAIDTTDRLLLGNDAGLVKILLGASAVPTAVLGPLEITTGGGANIRAGNGAASGTQPKGSLWMRTDGGVGSTLYVSQGGGTWNPVAGV